MSKVLKTAAIVVAAGALIASGVGAAAGAGLIGGTLASGAAGFLGVAASTLTAIGTIAGVAAAALSIAAQVTAKKPSAAAATGSQTTFAADPDAGIPAVLGRTGTAGNIIFRRGFDTRDAGDNDRQSFVAALSLGPVHAIEGQTVDRSPVSYTATGAAIGAFAGFMWSMTQLGALPEAQALSFGADAGTPPGWTAQHKLSGLAAASWTLRFDTKAKLFQNGVPAPMWVVQGGLCYDPRKDSTYPGGNGPHRMADPSDTAAYDAAVATWEYSENPYLHGLKYAHGYWQRDTSDPSSKWQRVMGMGAAWSAIDAAAFVEGANIAETNDWKVGGVIYSGDDKWATLKKILQAGMGEPLPLGARVSCLVNAPKVSLATIGVDDVVGAATVQATQPRRDRINTITPRFRTEANNWQLLSGSPISVPQHVALDRGKRSRVQDYAFIQDAAQAGTAARYDIENAREFGPIVLPLKLVWMGYRPGDCVTANLPEVGLNNQPILLLNREIGAGSAIVTMTARSETAAKHPFALNQTATPAPTPGVSTPPIVPTPHPSNWDARPLPTAPDVVSPTLIVSGRAVPNVDAVIFEFRETGSDEPWSVAGAEPPGTERRDITGLKAGTSYEVAISYRLRAAVSDRLILSPVTTGADGAADAIEGVVDAIEQVTNPAIFAPKDKLALYRRVQERDRWWYSLQAAFIGLAPPALPGEDATVAFQAADASRRARLAVLTAIAPAWDDLTTSSPVDQAALTAALDAVEVALNRLDTALKTRLPTGAVVQQLAEPARKDLLWMPDDTVVRAYRPQPAAAAYFGATAATFGSTDLTISPGPAWTDTADKTSAVAPRLDGPASVTIAADADGSTTTPLPKVVQLYAFEGSSDVTATADWALDAPPAGIVASINTTDARGRLTITKADAAGDLNIRVAFPRGGSSMRTVKVQRTRAGQDATGGAGSASASTASWNDPASTTHAQITPILTVKSTAAGALTVRAAGSFQANTAYESNAYLKLAYRKVGTTTWSDVSAEVIGSPAVPGTDSPLPSYKQQYVEPTYDTPGYVDVPETAVSGLTASTDYEIAAFARLVTAGRPISWLGDQLLTVRA